MNAYLMQHVGSSGMWDGGYSVTHISDKTNKRIRLGMIALPDSDLDNYRLENLFQAYSADQITREGMDHAIVFFPENTRDIREEIKVLLPKKREVCSLGDRESIQNGLPTKVSPELARALIEEANGYHETKR